MRARMSADQQHSIEAIRRGAVAMSELLAQGPLPTRRWTALLNSSSAVARPAARSSAGPCASNLRGTPARRQRL